MKWYFGLLMAGMPFLLGFGAASSRSHRQLTEVDSGSTIEIYPNDRFEVALKGNPTAGYQWDAREWDEAILKLISQPAYEQQSSAIGVGGIFTFTFEAITAGQSSVHLIYHRPFEKNRQPLKSFEITVQVRKISP